MADQARNRRAWQTKGSDMSTVNVGAEYCASDGALVVTVTADGGTAVIHEIWGAVQRGGNTADLATVTPATPAVFIFHGVSEGRVGVNATFGTRGSSAVTDITTADNCAVGSTTSAEPSSTSAGSSVPQSTSAASTSTTEPAVTTSTADTTTTTAAVEITEGSVPTAAITTTTVPVVSVPVTLPRTGAGDHAGAIGSGLVLVGLGVAMVLGARRRVLGAPR